RAPSPTRLARARTFFRSAARDRSRPGGPRNFLRPPAARLDENGSATTLIAHAGREEAERRERAQLRRAPRAPGGDRGGAGEREDPARDGDRALPGGGLAPQELPRDPRRLPEASRAAHCGRRGRDNALRRRSRRGGSLSQAT